MKNRKTFIPILAVAALIVIVVLITLAARFIERFIPSKEVMDMQKYYGLTKEDDMAMVVNDKLLDATCKYIDGEVYVDFNTVHDKFNDRFYWDASENVLLYTLPDSQITVNAGGTEYLVDKTSNKENYTIVRVDGQTMYLALDFIEKYTNMTHKIYEAPNHVVITSKWGDVDSTTVKTDTQLRYKGGIKSPIVKQLKKEDKITVLKQDKTWTKVATEDGIIGYMKTKFMGKVGKTTRSHNFTEPVFKHISKNFTVQMAWHQVTNAADNTAVANVLKNSKGINVMSPTWFYMNDNQGNIASLANKSYVDYCHQNKIEVWALVSNFENKDVDSTAVLNKTSTRQNLVNQLVAAAIEYNLDGINVDMEALKSEAGNGFLQFVRELTLKCKNNGIVVSVDNTVPKDFSAFYDRGEQSNYADYIVIMGYDEHYAGSDEGSVASLGFVTEGVKNTLKEVPAKQVILACPFYTRIWAETPKPDASDTVEAASKDYVPYDLTSEAVGMDTVTKRLNVNGVTPSWSEADGQNYAEYVKDGVTYKVWIEDATSLEKKLEVMKSNKLAGAAFWKLGFETNSIWDTIIKYTE